MPACQTRVTACHTLTPMDEMRTAVRNHRGRQVQSVSLDLIWLSAEMKRLSENAMQNIAYSSHWPLLSSEDSLF